MKKGLIAFLACSILVVTACADRDDELTAANIRIKNNSTLDFDLVEIIADSLLYENVAAEGFSSYLSFDEAFQQMPMTIVTDSTTFNYTVNDSVQEPLPIGLYTYEINLSEEGGVNVVFKID